MNSVKINNLSLKNQRFTPSDCIEIEIISVCDKDLIPFTFISSFDISLQEKQILFDVLLSLLSICLLKYSLEFKPYFQVYT